MTKLDHSSAQPPGRTLRILECTGLGETFITCMFLLAVGLLYSMTSYKKAGGDVEAEMRSEQVAFLPHPLSIVSADEETHLISESTFLSQSL